MYVKYNLINNIIKKILVIGCFLEITPSLFWVWGLKQTESLTLWEKKRRNNSVKKATVKYENIKHFDNGAWGGEKKDMQSGFVFHHLDSAVCRKSSACLRLPLLCDLKYTEHTHTYNTHCTTQGLYIHVTLEHPIQKRSWSACLKISELSCRKHKLLHKHAGGIQKDIRSKHWPWTGSQCEAGLQRRHPGLSRSLRNARSCSHTRSRGCLTAGKGTTTESQHTHTHTH